MTGRRSSSWRRWAKRNWRIVGPIERCSRCGRTVFEDICAVTFPFSLCPLGVEHLNEKDD